MKNWFTATSWVDSSLTVLPAKYSLNLSTAPVSSRQNEFNMHCSPLTREVAVLGHKHIDYPEERIQ